MSTSEVAKNEPEEQQQPQEDQVEELTEEEKQQQKEIQEKMKNVKIDEAYFAGDSKHKNKKNKKEENKKAKKNAKGQDFLDYANQNNIPINIQYEEDKYALEKKKAYDNKKDYKYPHYKSDNNKPYKKQYHNNNNNQNNDDPNYKPQPQHKYQHKNQNYKRGPKRPKFAYGGNKFDAVNAQMVFSETQHIPTTPVPPPQGPLLQRQAVLTTDEEVLKFVEQMFGSTNLNRDLYLRKHIDNGEIKLANVVEYNTLKNNKISEEKLIEVLKNSEELELKGEDSKSIVIKGYKDMTLLTVDEMLSNKKSKMQRMNNPMYAGPMDYMPYVGGYNNNYIHMQNNYFMPPHFYSMPGYGQPVYYQPPQQFQPNITQNTNEEA